MRRPSEKRCINDKSDQKGNEEDNQEDAEDSTIHEDLSEVELMLEDEAMEDDRGQGSQPKPKTPMVPHKK